MVSKEYIQLMSEQEVKILKEEIKPTPTFLILIFQIIFFGSAYFIWKDSALFIWLWTSLSVFMIGATLFLFITFRRKATKDLRGAHKKIMCAILEKKSEDSSVDNTQYYCTIGQEEFEVSYTQWQELSINEMTEIHFAPTSKYIFFLSQES